MRKSKYKKYKLGKEHSNMDMKAIAAESAEDFYKRIEQLDKAIKNFEEINKQFQESHKERKRDEVSNR